MEYGGWKPVFYKGVDYGRYYSASSCGNIKSFHNGKETILVMGFCGPKRRQYKKVILCMDGIKIQAKVHHIIYESFNGKHKYGLIIDHKDGDSLNNEISNLQAITHRHNCSRERTIKSKLPIGVHLEKATRKYRASIFFRGKHIHLGLYLNVKQAAEAYKKGKNVIMINDSPTKRDIVKSVNSFRESIGLKKIIVYKTTIE